MFRDHGDQRHKGEVLQHKKHLASNEFQLAQTGEKTALSGARYSKENWGEREGETLHQISPPFLSYGAGRGAPKWQFQPVPWLEATQLPENFHEAHKSPTEGLLSA